MFAGGARKISGKLRWIGSAAKPEGNIVGDDGAARAVIAGGKSLLPSGITTVSGTFDRGAVVMVVNLTGQELARGLTNYSSEELLKIKGLRSDGVRKKMGEGSAEEAIHRDNLIETAG